MTDKPTTRRDLMKPVQLLGLAFGAALFAGFITLMSMGFFQARPADQIQRALVVGLVAAGATFIVVLVSVSLMLLAVDPAKVTKTVDRPLLLPKEAPDATNPGAGAEASAPSERAVPPRADDTGSAPRS
ncbi:amino acid transporter [Microbacterium testaceum]|uniref:amino acid transporter n=1 Tax=Microbacterium testaceum TaxID=2033 RepID=UPI001FAF907F|nr:amino acid transporter [Microbacterium testaceum]